VLDESLGVRLSEDDEARAVILPGTAADVDGIRGEGAR
jgi:hypothetical protein